jgi:hypothetical protein
MSQHTVNRKQAGRFTLMARVAVGVLVVGALSIAVFGLPEPPSRERTGPIIGFDDPGTSPGTGSTGSGSPLVDAEGIAIRLSQLANAPKVVATIPTEPSDDGMIDDLPNLMFPVDEIRFLGVIKEPDRLLALTRISGRQTVMWPGRIFEGIELLEVTPEWILIDQDGAEQRIERAERTALALNKIIVPSAPQPMRGGPEMPTANQDQGNRSRDEAQRLLQDARSRARTIRAGAGVQGSRVTDPSTEGPQ